MMKFDFWGAVAALTVLILLSAPAHAQVEVEIRRGQIRAIPIAIANFTGSDAQGGGLAQQTSQIISAVSYTHLTLPTKRIV